MSTEHMKVRVDKVGREVPHPYDPDKTIFTGFEMSGGVIGVDYSHDPPLLGGYSPDELRQLIREQSERELIGGEAYE